MQQLFNQTELQKVQDHFCTLSHLFAYCINMDGQRLTAFSGEKEQLDKIRTVVTDEDFYQLYKHVLESELEDMIVESTMYDNIKLAGVSVRDKGARSNCWLICCVLSDVTEGKLFEIEDEGITTKQFYASLDLLVDVQKKLLENERELLSARNESDRSRFSESEMSSVLKRAEAMTSIVQFLESDDSFENTATEILQIVGEFLGVSAVRIIQIQRDGEHIDFLCHYYNKESNEPPTQTKGLARGPLVSGSKPLILSSNTLSSAGLRAELLKFHIKAMVSCPIFVNDKPAMYFCVEEHNRERTWMVEDIKFISDVVKILQSLLNKRIQKTSLAGSYASLQEILDNVGTCVYVKDASTGKGLFANKLFKTVFRDELEKGVIDDLMAGAKPVGVKDGYYEVEHEEKGRWYDLYHVQIRWIDGRLVDLYALYDITDKKVYQRKIEQQAYTDFLTGLYNRLCCERDLAVFVDKALNKRTQGAILYMDLDDFKHINDGLGHQYGDILLQDISHAFMRVKGVENSCYRMGGDEFVIIIPPESYHRFDGIVEDVKNIFNKPWFLKDADYYCTMSMGICCYPDDGRDVADLIKKADIAMYEAKKTGKNRVAKYSSNFNSASSKRLDMEKNMRDATGKNCSEFAVYFQPIIDATKENHPCVGAEALVRWNSAALGFISPGEFIPLAEYLGLITPIGTYVLREACYACKKWNDKGHPDYKVNVNLSVVQLLQNDIVDVIRMAIKDTDIDPKNLTLEVTESLAINDMKRMQGILGSIRELGVKIALDDFGTGYSSLNHIREIPLDVIKVDQTFVKDLAVDEYSQSFIKMVAELGSAIDVSICVEGIETKAQYEVLEDMRIQYIQGYYFDKPLPRSEFEAKYVD